MANCKECRFYEKSKCLERNFRTEPYSSTCSYFSAYSTRNDSDFRQCKDCRFYSGGRCSERDCSTYPTSSKCGFGSICR